MRTDEATQPTSASLLERLRRPEDAAAWQRFVELYSPLLYRWVCRLGLDRDDAADLVQEVFALLVVKLPTFAYDNHRRFRGWLWTVTLNKLREHKRGGTLPTRAVDDTFLQGVAEPSQSDPFDEAEYREYLISRALRVMESEFQPTTWRAVWEHVANGRPAPEVAAELKMTPGAVYAAKVRVLARLREELAGLLD